MKKNYPNFHTVKYKNHSVGYIFHTVGYKSRTVKQRILKGKIKYAAGHPNFIAGAAGSIRRTRQKKSRKPTHLRMSAFRIYSQRQG